VTPRIFPVLLLVAAWWPSRAVGLLDGAPFDNAPDAVVLGLVLPLLLWLTPAAFRSRAARVAILVLLVWKAIASIALVQDGWCARVEPSRPYVTDGTGVPKNWDVRADWLSPDPRCSAIATRAYLTDDAFPVWFFNLPSATKDTGPSPEDIPPLAVTHLTMRSTIVAAADGVLKVRSSTNVAARLSIDGVDVSVAGAHVAAGRHEVVITATLHDVDWMLAPLWNDADAFTTLPATIAPPSVFDRALKPFGRWLPFLIIAFLVAIGVASLWREIRDRRVAAWVGASTAAGAAVAVWMPARQWHYAMLALFAAMRMPLPPSLRNVRGAFILLAPFWLALHVVDTYLDIGFDRTQRLMPGNDWWQSQRYAYRIFMQGYWLEGGELTFKFRPLYRWIAGALHLLFGQSQTGENYWDAILIVVMALFAFEIVRRYRGFEWGIGAAALTLTAYLSGPGHVFIGRGLSDITSAGLIYLSALCMLAARDSRSTTLLIVASVCALLGAAARENNVPMALAVVMFAWPVDARASVIWRPREWFAGVWRPALVAVPLALLLGAALFALRAWHYTGELSAGVRSQSDLMVWRPSMSVRDGIAAMASSVMMIATTVDPPRFHNGALPVLAGFFLSVLAVLGAPFARGLPLSLVVWTLAAFSPALLVRGSAYSGRFSVHVIGCTAAVVTCAAGAAISARADRRRRQRARLIASDAA
jgi:hypothetical protein